MTVAFDIRYSSAPYVVATNRFAASNNGASGTWEGYVQRDDAGAGGSCLPRVAVHPYVRAAMIYLPADAGNVTLMQYR